MLARPMRGGASEQQLGHARQHAEKQPGVHPGDAQVVFERIEMRQPIRWVGDAGWDKVAVVTLPVETHHDFGVKVHAFPQQDLLGQRQRWRQRIDAKTAHTVFKRQRQRFNPHPNVGDPASV